jgi:hypothetical protein
VYIYGASGHLSTPLPETVSNPALNLIERRPRPLAASFRLAVTPSATEQSNRLINN